jgi:hypothetical protein
MVKALTAALAAGAQSPDFWREPNSAVVQGSGQTILTVYPQDADLQQTTPEALADAVVKQIQAALAGEDLRRLYGTASAPGAAPAHAE